MLSSGLTIPIQRQISQASVVRPFPDTLFKGVRYTNEARALFARMTTVPDATRRRLMDNVFSSLISTGWYPQLDAIWLPAGADNQSTRLNLKGPSFTLSPVNSPTFTIDRGWAGDGVTSYLNTNFTPSVDGVNYTQNSASIACYLNAGTDTAFDNAFSMGCVDGTTGADIRPRNAANFIGRRLNQSASSATAATVPTRLGLTALDRPNATTVNAYKNGSPAGSWTQASAGRPPLPFFLCGANFNGALSSPVNNRVAAAWISGSLGAAGHAAVYSIIYTYLAAIGAN